MDYTYSANIIQKMKEKTSKPTSKKLKEKHIFENSKKPNKVIK